MINDQETRPLLGIPGYLARADGQIVRERDGRVLAQRIKGRYREVQLYLNGNQRQRRLHALMIRAFYGDRPGLDCWATFKDGNSLNCRADNLIWMRDRRDAQIGSYGEEAFASKLTTEQVIDALNRYVAGELPRLIGERYGVTGRTIRDITNGFTWPHVERPDELKHIELRPRHAKVQAVAA